MIEHDGSLKMEFWTGFGGGVFWSKNLEDDLGRLRKLLTKWRLDLGSGGCLELNGMIEIVE